MTDRAVEGFEVHLGQIGPEPVQRQFPGIDGFGDERVAQEVLETDMDAFLFERGRAILGDSERAALKTVSRAKFAKRGKLSSWSMSIDLDVAPVRSEILGSRIVRAVGPRYYQTVVDAVIRKG